MIDTLPCPRCRSRKTLSSLQMKCAAIKARIEASQRDRHTVPFTISLPGPLVGGTRIQPHQIRGFSAQGVQFDSPSIGPGLDIKAPNEPGVIMINGAILDVCMDCGTFYASNAARLCEDLETEIAELDPLGALADIDRTDGAVDQV
ncbi:MAG: hypothetical protein AB7L09_02890 [Nitrospira sp.]